MAGEQGYIKYSQLTQAGRRRFLTVKIPATTTIRTGILLGRAAVLKACRLYQDVVAVGGPTAVNIGTAATAAAYGTLAPSATQAADTQVTGTVTGTRIPATGVLLVTAAANTTGEATVTLEFEVYEEDVP